MEMKVTRMEDLLNNISDTNANKTECSLVTQSANSKNDKTIKVEEEDKITVLKGKYKSGRVWKEPKKRFSSIVKTRGLRVSLEKKQKLREDLKRVKEMSRAVIAGRKAEKEEKKQRRIENLKRAEENRKKSEVVQVIKNTSKIKRMKKKQLRMIEKRDTTNM